MINYVEKGSGLHRAIESAGHWLECRGGAWVSSDDVAVQAIIDSYDPLPDLKAAKVAAIKAEGLRRIQSVLPAIENFEELRLLREILMSVKATSLQLTTDITRVRDIYTAGSNAVATVNGYTTIAKVNAFDAINSVGWPA